MASERYLTILPGDTSNTYDTVYFSFEAGVTTSQAGNYFIRYQVGSKSKVDTSTFYIAAGGTYSTYEFNQSGLSSGTTYTINATLYVAANNTAVATAQLSVKTKTAPTYYGKVVLDGNGGTYSGGSTITYEGKKASTSSPTEIAIAYADPGFTKSGYSLIGFSKSSSATSATYGTSGTYYVSSTSTSSSSPTKVTLYAVWGNAKPSKWSWTSTIGGTLELTKISDGNYEVYPLTAKEWNAFLDRIREWGEYLNISLWDSDFTNAAAIQNYPMEAGNAIFVVSLLQQLGASPPSAPKSGDPITASFINGLATALNNLE